MNCVKKCIFAVIQTTGNKFYLRVHSCELRQKVYLCSNTNNRFDFYDRMFSVVNCVKKCIFAVIQTTGEWTNGNPNCCELRQKVYLCSNTNNIIFIRNIYRVVVNCVKKCIFAVIQTTLSTFRCKGSSCELRQKVYLCSNTNNLNYISIC